MGIIIPRLGRRWGYAARGVEYGSLAADRLPDFLPSSIPNLAAWYRADQGVTLGATPLAAGTVPPVVTLSGTLNQSIGLYIQIDFAGTLGVATFKWSVNNGTTFAATGVPTAASVVLGTTGITAAFPAGAYLTDNIYRVTISQWNDLSGNGNNATNGTGASQPLAVAALPVLNNKPTVRGDGVDDTLTISGTLLANTGACTYFVVSCSNVTVVDGCVFGNGLAKHVQTTHNNQTTMFTYCSTAQTAISYPLNGGSGTTANLHTTIWTGTNAANGEDVYKNGVAVTAVTAGATSGDTTDYKIFGGAAGTGFMGIDIAEIVLYKRVLSASELSSVHKYLGARYAIAVP